MYKSILKKNKEDSHYLILRLTIKLGDEDSVIKENIVDI